MSKEQYIIGGKWITLLSFPAEPEWGFILDHVSRIINQSGLDTFVQSQNQGDNYCLVEFIRG